MANILAGLLQPTRYTTWRPTWRLHLAHAFLSALITLFSITAAWPLYTSMIAFAIVGGLALALCSRFPWPGALLGSASAWAGTLMMTDVPISPGIIPWLCTAVLVARGFPRMPAYSLVVFSLVLLIADARWGETSEGWISLLAWWVVVGGGAITLAELIRSPRDQAERSLHTYRESMERQRLLVVTELHDTVVRDLTHAVMTAEQVRLAHPENDLLVRELGTMIGSVRTSVEQLRHSLRAIRDLRGEEHLDLLATEAPRPLREVVAEAGETLGRRGVDLVVEGIGVFDETAIPPGIRVQLTRVLGELVTNTTKYAAPSGSARIVVESDGDTVEALVSNDVAASPGKDPATSSGLGLEGARRRIESLGGTFDVTRTPGRWTVVLSIPLRPAL